MSKTGIRGPDGRGEARRRPERKPSPGRRATGDRPRLPRPTPDPLDIGAQREIVEMRPRRPQPAPEPAERQPPRKRDGSRLAGVLQLLFIFGASTVAARATFMFDAVTSVLSHGLVVTIFAVGTVVSVVLATRLVHRGEWTPREFVATLLPLAAAAAIVMVLAFHPWQDAAPASGLTAAAEGVEVPPKDTLVAAKVTHDGQLVPGTLVAVPGGGGYGIDMANRIVEVPSFATRSPLPVLPVTEEVPPGATQMVLCGDALIVSSTDAVISSYSLTGELLGRMTYGYPGVHLDLTCTGQYVDATYGQPGKTVRLDPRFMSSHSVWLNIADRVDGSAGSFGHAYFNDPVDQRALILRKDTEEPVKVENAGGEDATLVPVDGKVMVALPHRRCAVEIDTAKAEATPRSALGPGPTFGDAYRNEAYFVDKVTGYLTIIDLSDPNRTPGRIHVADAPSDAAVVPDTGDLIVTDATDGTIRIVDREALHTAKREPGWPLTQGCGYDGVLAGVGPVAASW